MRFKLFENRQEVNVIEADLRFVTKFCEEHGLTFEEDMLPLPAQVPTIEDRLDALEAALQDDDVWTALDNAYSQGYTEGVNAV